MADADEHPQRRDAQEPLASSIPQSGGKELGKARGELSDEMKERLSVFRPFSNGLRVDEKRWPRVFDMIPEWPKSKAAIESRTPKDDASRTNEQDTPKAKPIPKIITPKKGTRRMSNRHFVNESAVPILSDEQNGYKKSLTFTAGYANEPVMYAYAGFTDLAAGRRWLVSPPALVALEAYVASGNTPAFHKAMAIHRCEHEDWVKDGPTLEWAMEEWPVETQVDRVQAATSSKENSLYILAFLLYWLPKESDRFCRLSLEEQHKEYSALQKRYPYPLPVWDEFAGVSLTSPIWNHPDDKIPLAEKSSRVFALLRFHWSKIGKGEKETTFAQKFGQLWGVEGNFSSVEIDNRSKPIWMRELRVLSSASYDKKPEPKLPSKLSPRKIVLRWPSFKEHALQLGLKRVDEDEREKLKLDREEYGEQLKLPLEYHRDPRDYPSVKIWRDLLRLDLKLADLKMSIGTLALHDFDEDGDPELRSFFARDRTPRVSWSQFLALLEATDDKPLDVYLCTDYQGGKFTGEMEWEGSLEPWLTKPHG